MIKIQKQISFFLFLICCKNPQKERRIDRKIEDNVYYVYVCVSPNKIKDIETGKMKE